MIQEVQSWNGQINPWQVSLLQYNFPVYSQININQASLIAVRISQLFPDKGQTLTTDLVYVEWEGEGLVQDEGGDADDAHADPDDGDGHLGAPLSPEHGSGDQDQKTYC